MKKSFIILILCCATFGIAHASVESDTTAIRYKTCIAELAKMESLRLKQPDPNRPVFYREGEHEFTYEMAMKQYTNQGATIDKKKTECNNLSGQIQKVENPTNKEMNQYVDSIGNSTQISQDEAFVGYARFMDYQDNLQRDIGKMHKEIKALFGIMIGWFALFVVARIGRYMLK